MIRIRKRFGLCGGRLPGMAIGRRRRVGVCRPLLLFLLVCVLGGCDKKPEQVTLTGDALGTTYHVTLVDRPEQLARDRVHIAIERLLEQVALEVSVNSPSSVLSRFNALPPGQWFPVSQDLLALVRSVKAVSETSGLPSSSYPDVLLQETPPALQKRRWLALDVAPVTRGYAVDSIAALLLSQGINRFLVEVGGVVRVSGLDVDGKPWAIALPGAVRDTQAGYRQALSLSDKALAAARRDRGTAVQMAAAQPQVSVTVLADTAVLAEAWAAGFVQLGADVTLSLADQQQLPVYQVMQAGEEQTTRMNPLMQSFLAP